MHVIISGYYGFGNSGDEAILSALIQLLKSVDATIQITVLSVSPAQTEKNHGVKAVDRWNYKEIRRAIRHSDGVISGGGSLLQDETGMRSVPYYTSIMLLSMFYRKPFIVYAHGIGPIHYKRHRWWTRWILSRASLLSVRDSESKHLLQKFGIRRPIEVVPDPVMYFRKKLHLRGERTPSNRDITVAVRAWKLHDTYKTKIAKALDFFIEKDYNIVFVPMHGEEDEQVSRAIISKMKHAKAPVLIYNKASFEEKMGLIGKSQLLFAMRLHALIFAAANDVPFIGLSYDPKIDAFCKRLDQPIIGTVAGSWTEQDLIDLIQNQLDQREKIVEHLDQVTISWCETLEEITRRSLEAIK